MGTAPPVANGARLIAFAARVAAPLRAGLRFNLTTLGLIFAIDTGIALLLWINEQQPFWQPFVSVQVHGLAMAYCINVAAAWDHDRPLRRLAIATLAGAFIGLVLVIVVKRYTVQAILEMPGSFVFNLLAAFITGYALGLMFYVKRREARADAAMHKAEAERHLLSKQAVEAELKLMQAQVEPHFLFNTLASVHYLTETDPPKATALLGHLIDYLRVALPELRARSSTLAREFALADAYLRILAMRLGPRLRFAIDLPAELRDHPFPPNLVISLVENAIRHGIEPARDGGSVTLAAGRTGDNLVVLVTDTGCGLGASSNPGQGVGLANLRERLCALYGTRAQFELRPTPTRGARATITIPCETAPEALKAFT
jgi:sensor histidine kinase YesM